MTIAHVTHRSHLTDSTLRYCTVIFHFGWGDRKDFPLELTLLLHILLGSHDSIRRCSVPFLRFVQRIMSSNSQNALGHPSLQPKTPVPSDIQVSMDIVKNVGLLSMEDLAQQ